MSDLLNRTITLLTETFEVVDTHVHENVWTVIAGSTTLVFLSCVAYHDHKLRGGMHRRIFQKLATAVKWLPPVHNYLVKSLASAQVDITNLVHKEDTSSDWVRRLPETGRDAVDVLADVIRYGTLENGGSSKRNKPNYLQGAVSGAVFNTEENHDELRLLQEVFARTAYSNPLWPGIFPDVRRMEAEVVELTKNLLHGGPDVVGTMTSGGSMSILQACLAYRNRSFDAGIDYPEIILPASAHAAFFKAAELFRIRVVEIQVSDTNFIADPERVRKAITRNTCAIVGSVPNYPYGTSEDIEALGSIALRYGVPLHVDGCCGAFLLPFFDQNDAIPPFDFRVPGVTSISADTHKYGLAPKGSSVILFNNADLRAKGFYANADWCGGIYASPTIEGSRNGSAIATTWAALQYNGEDKLRRSAANVRRVTRELREKIVKLDGMQLLGQGDICIIAWTNTKVDDYRLIDHLETAGFFVSPLQFPKGAHLMVTPLHGKPGYVDSLLKAMREGIAAIIANPEASNQGTAAMYGMTIDLPDRTVVQDLANLYLKTIYDFPPTSSAQIRPEEFEITFKKLRKEARAILFENYENGTEEKKPLLATD